MKQLISCFQSVKLSFKAAILKLIFNKSELVGSLGEYTLFQFLILQLN